MDRFFGFRGKTHVLMDTEIVDGVVCRVGTMDSYFVKESKWSYGWMDVHGQTVMDIGANIGTYAVLAVRNGCERLICYEPHPINFSLLCKNSPTSMNIEAGIARVEERCDLYATPDGKNQGSFTKYSMRGRNVCARQVKFLSFRDELQKHRPSVLKIDCERAEHEFLKEPLPDHVRQVTIEIHFGRIEWMKSAEQIVALFKDWEVVRAPIVKKGRWHTLAGWKR